MHKGDFIHIMPGVAHWTVLEPGMNFVFWAVKIEVPHAAAAPAAN
jgi:quercetin dioxygenase-like cupin family protein